MENTSYLVGTGRCVFRIDAASPAAAIAQLKANIDARRHVRRHETIGMSLVEALDAGRLNFVVFDAKRTSILAGELNGQHQEPTDLEFRRRLLGELPHIIPDACVWPHLAGSAVEASK